MKRDGWQVKEDLEALFENDGKFVFCGYVDDPRNTDNAWMETCRR